MLMMALTKGITMKPMNITGDTYGHLHVLEPAGKHFIGQQYRNVWLCECVCGNRVTVAINALRSGNTKSCGCKKYGQHKKHECARKNRQTKEYVAWKNMKQRCYNKNRRDYYLYGGRGIIVCNEWRTSFEAFLEDMGEAPSNKHSLDRIDVNGIYKPGNCRWATPHQQRVNQRDIRAIRERDSKGRYN